jgi:hypothetical protein
MEKRRSMKVAIIAGASEALKYQNRNPRATEQEIIQHVNDKANEIIENIEKDAD